ncbi:MAG: DegT/DnrJ/EryC1/StrS family aminotransferase [Oscillospiraceae bacterium]|nr:DegT/DnrJ/EryC1/StrS family aminotransferase [Oscillospiraceae bacterium]
MKRIHDNQNNIEQLRNVLPNSWGTIGPRFVEASEAIAAHFSMKHGLLLFSVSAALETILRGWNISYGDEVIVASWSDPLDSMVTAAVGATPVFADVCPDTFTLSAAQLEGCLTPNTKAVIADLPAGNPCNAKALSAFCKAKGIRLILNLGDSWDTTFEGKPIASYADAAFLNLSEQKVVDLGLAGGIVTDDADSFNLFYAYHNCGRPFGDGCTLSFDSIIGGDFRVAEWQAALLVAAMPGIADTVATCRARYDEIVTLTKDGFAPIQTVENGRSSCAGVLLAPNGGDQTAALKKLSEAGYAVSAPYAAMHGQPFWSNGYFNKLTGKTVAATHSNYPNSINAASTLIFVSVEK